MGGSVEVSVTSEDVPVVQAFWMGGGGGSWLVYTMEVSARSTGVELGCETASVV